MPAPPAPVTSATRPAKRSDVRPSRQAGAAEVRHVSKFPPRAIAACARGHHSLVIDAHHHFVFPDRVSYPDLERAMPEINRALAPADLEPQLRAAEVDGTILVQAANDLAETSLLLEVAGAGLVGARRRGLDPARDARGSGSRARAASPARSWSASAISSIASPIRRGSRRRNGWNHCAFSLSRAWSTSWSRSPRGTSRTG